jgi:gluconolactonase
MRSTDYQTEKTMIRIVIAAVASVLAVALATAQAPTGGNVVRLDPALDALVSPDARVELVKDGFGFTEGTVWMPEGRTGRLLFTDIPGNVIWSLTPEGQASVFLTQVGYTGPEQWRWGGMMNNGRARTDPKFEEFPMIGANGLTRDPQGRLIIATYAGRSVVRIEKNGKRTVLADRFEGKRFGGPNDVVAKRDGAIYFTDGNGSMRLGARDPRRELMSAAVYMWKDGKVTAAIADMPGYNGLAFSPDEKYLYANAGVAKFVKRYEVRPDDTLTNGQMLIDLSKVPGEGITDGVRVDIKGNLWETAPGGGVWIISPEGKHLGTILAPEMAANLAFGDADRKTLYIAARGGIYKIRVNTPGI